MRTGWQCLGVGRKQVRKVPAMTAVARGQGGPEAAGRGRIAPAQHPRHDASTGAFDGQPEPYFVPPAAHKRPHLVQFKRLPVFLLRFFRPQARQYRAGLLRFFLPVWPPSCAPRRSRARCCAANYARPTAFLPGHNGLRARLRRVRTGLGARSRCNGSAHAHCCGRCGEFARCRIWRTSVESLPSTLYESHPNLDHRLIFNTIIITYSVGTARRPQTARW